MDRTVVRKRRLSEGGDHGYVPGTPRQRFAPVIGLTRIAARLAGYDLDQALRRDITVLRRRISPPAQADGCTLERKQ